MDISPDGGMIALGGTGHSVFLVDPLSGSWTEFKGHMGGPLVSVRFSSNGGQLIAAAGSVLYIWSVGGYFEPTQRQLMESKLAWKQEMARMIGGA
jgi:hypothetical protein